MNSIKKYIKKGGSRRMRNAEQKHYNKQLPRTIEEAGKKNAKLKEENLQLNNEIKKLRNVNRENDKLKTMLLSNLEENLQLKNENQEIRRRMKEMHNHTLEVERLNTEAVARENKLTEELNEANNEIIRLTTKLRDYISQIEQSRHNK